MNCLFKETKNLHFILLCAKINVILQHEWGYTLIKIKKIFLKRQGCKPSIKKKKEIK